MGVRVAISYRYCIAFEVMLLLSAGCHGNLTVLNLLSASVTKNKNFRPCRIIALDRKKGFTSFRIATTFSISMQSLGRSNYACWL